MLFDYWRVIFCPYRILKLGGISWCCVIQIFPVVPPSCRFGFASLQLCGCFDFPVFRPFWSSRVILTYILMTLTSYNQLFSLEFVSLYLLSGSGNWFIANHRNLNFIFKAVTNLDRQNILVFFPLAGNPAFGSPPLATAPPLRAAPYVRAGRPPRRPVSPSPPLQAPSPLKDHWPEDSANMMHQHWISFCGFFFFTANRGQKISLNILNIWLLRNITHQTGWDGVKMY